MSLRRLSRDSLGRNAWSFYYDGDDIADRSYRGYVPDRCDHVHAGRLYRECFWRGDLSRAGEHTRHTRCGTYHDRGIRPSPPRGGRVGFGHGDICILPGKLGWHRIAHLVHSGRSFSCPQFRSWEMFLVSLWGIAICGSMSSTEVPIKGWISGWIGLLVSFVGLDAIHGVSRFTFGSFYLDDGIGFIPVLIGLFGLAEILRVLPQKSPPKIPSDVGRVLPSLSTLIRYVKPSLRSGIIGTVIGAIPGAGANVASFFAYDVGRRRASKEERGKWGTGSYEAIVCAEVANNANVGGSMLPTLALGIPGNAAAAAILAALQLKNVVVGPLIQVENPGLIYFIYIGLIIANFFMYGMAIALIRPCVKLFSLPKTLLMPLILPVCVLGAFAVNLNFFDVYVMLISGLVGYVLHRFGFPLAPLVLAVILGPLADENLRRALLVFEDVGIVNVLWDRKLGTVLLLVVLYTFYDGIFRRGQRKDSS